MVSLFVPSIAIVFDKRLFKVGYSVDVFSCFLWRAGLHPERSVLLGSIIQVQLGTTFIAIGYYSQTNGEK